MEIYQQRMLLIFWKQVVVALSFFSRKRIIIWHGDISKHPFLIQMSLKVMMTYNGNMLS